MTIISDIEGANDKVIPYALAHQGGAAANARRVIRQADYLSAEQREALLGALEEALS